MQSSARRQAAGCVPLCPEMLGMQLQPPLPPPLQQEQQLAALPAATMPENGQQTASLAAGPGVARAAGPAAAAVSAEQGVALGDMVGSSEGAAAPAAVAVAAAAAAADSVRAARVAAGERRTQL